MLDLAILYTPPGGRPLRLANVNDHQLLVAVAEAAITEAAEKAQRLGAVDTFLGELEAAEAGRVLRVLSMFLPELGADNEKGLRKPC